MTEDNSAIWFEAPGVASVRKVPRPKPGEGEVLIRTLRTLISGGTEITILNAPAAADSSWIEFARFPRPAGYSHAGIIVEAGHAVDESWMGKRVASRCRHAAWVTSKIGDLRIIPEKVTPDEATFATLAAVAMNGFRRVHLSFGETVAVFGLGILGQLSARIAAAAGAWLVFGIETIPFRLNQLPPGAAMCPYGGDLASLAPLVLGRTHNQGADIAVEATGNAAIIPCEARIVRDQGRLLLLSSPREPTSFDFHDFCNRRSLSIVGAHGFSQPATGSKDFPWTSQRNGELFLDWLAEGRLTVSELVTHRFPVEMAADAYRLLNETPQEALGVVFEWA